MKAPKKSTNFQEKFQDSEANYSQTGQYKMELNRNEDANGYPIQLIKIKQNGKIQVNEEALNIIAQFNQPIGFVSIVGKMRTGKSCLLNRLLGLTGKGFKVDPSTSSCTQGIWMWSVPQFNYEKNSYIFYMDTEGTDSLQKDIENDTKIFTLSLLIATYFIYNSVGSIDERSLSEIQMITALSKQIKTDEKLSDKDNQQNLYRYMPKFLWVLRDFTLKIQDQKGRKITPTQYLQNSLSDQGYNQKVNENSRKIKKSIMNYFKDRECVTLVRPVGDQNQLQKMNNIPDHALRKEFVEGVNNLHAKILKNTYPKTYEGQMVTGPAMASMIESYVQSFNSDKIPNIKSAWQQISQDQGAAAYNRALQRYEQIFRQQFPDDVPKGQQIYRILSKLKDETLKQFSQNLYQDKNEDYLKKLKQVIKQKQIKILQINSNLNELRNEKILQKYAKKIQTKKQSGVYKKNKDELLNDIKDMTDKYNSQAKGQKKGQIITEYILDLTNYIQSIQTKVSGKDDEEKRKAQIKLQEFQKQNKLQKSQLQSLKQQLLAKQSAQALNNKQNSKIKPGKQPKREEGGCCSGDKCQIM